MFAFVIKKIGGALTVLLGVVLIVFILFFIVLPADPARLTMGQRADKKTIENARRDLNLDQPIHKQFLLYLNDLAPLSIYNNTDENQQKYKYTKVCQIGRRQVLVVKWPYLQRSYQTKKEVSKMLWEAFPGTFILALLSIFFATILGITLGTISAVKQGTWMDTTAIFSSIVGISAPSFFAGIFIAYLFGFVLADYTGLSIVSPLWDYEPGQGRHLVLKSLILPVFTLAIRPLAIITQITRSAMLDVLNQDFIRTAKAKGLSFMRIIRKHALRNTLNPIITAVSGWFAELLAGSFFIEYIFGWKGIGKITIDALNKFDFPVVMGSILFTSTLFICINVMVDFLYRWVDPRIQ